MEKMIFIAKREDKLLNLVSEQGLSYNYCSKLLRSKDIRVNGEKVKTNEIVNIGDEICVFYQNDSIKSGFTVIFEDENVLVVSKDAGIEVEGENGLEGKTGCIAVHRLDRNTQGLLIMAKNREAEKELLAAIKNRSIIKKYYAEVVGKTNFKGEAHEAYLEKDNAASLVKIFKNKAKNGEKTGKKREKIVTKFKTIKTSMTSSLVECELVTGKTHQIRAHLAFLGHPIIGDGKYGKNEDNKKFKKKYQQLFCFSLELNGLGEKLSYLNGKKFELEQKYFFKNQ